MKKSVLFVAPFISETRKDDQAVYPMHQITQGYIGALRQSDFEVTPVSTIDEFLMVWANFENIVVLGDGRWLTKEITLIHPLTPVIYFYIITEPEPSLFVKSCPISPFNVDFLTPDEVVEKLKEFFPSD